MASIRDITAMCRNGQIAEAYDLAKTDLKQQQPWSHSEMGWVLYYLIKQDTESANYTALLSHLDELNALDRLTIPEDNMIFENVLFKMAGFVKDHVHPTDINSPAKLAELFSKLRQYAFEPSRGYSFLLQTFIKHDGWMEMADFLDWWNLEKLTEEDYAPYRMENGRTIMSLAERAFIAKSKALLRKNDLGRIEEFLPQLDDLMENHPEMTYPGYFYGKLLITLGSNPEDALRVIVPFARRKATEFWVWQLLSDVFANDSDERLACLLRAVNCRTQEKFLGKVRIKLAGLFIQRHQLDCAKYQIDKVTRCYLSQGWHLPYEVDCWVLQPWINTVNSNDNAPIDYMTITNAILCEGAEEAIAIVSHYNHNTGKVTLVYGYEKKTVQKLRFRVGPGAVLKINFVAEHDGRIRLLSAGQTRFPDDLDYAKIVEGTVRKRSQNPFAFLRNDQGNYYIHPTIVQRYHLQDRETVKGLAVYDYNQDRNEWSWKCVSINRQNNN